MTIFIPSHDSSTQFAIKMMDPLWITNRRTFPDIGEQIEGYNHSIGADGGYISAGFSLKEREETIEDWLSALGRDIVVQDNYLDEIFNGFINELTINVGTVSLKVGPLLDVVNRTRVVYTPRLLSTDPTIVGTERSTVLAEDTDSQAKYGILEKFLSGGQLYDEQADELRDLYLSEFKEPIIEKDVSIGSPTYPTVSISVAGYKEWLKVYPYSYSTLVTSTISAKIIAVLAADPNGILSTDTTHITTNASLCEAYEADNRTAETVLNELVAYGDYSANRMTFGIYKGRIAYYKTVPTTIEYEHNIRDNYQYIHEVAGGMDVPLWRVKPGKWLTYQDFMVGKKRLASSVGSDRRNMFIETVNYTMTHGLTLNGSRFGKMRQRAAQLGMSF